MGRPIWDNATMVSKVRDAKRDPRKVAAELRRMVSEWVGLNDPDRVYFYAAADLLEGRDE